MEAESPGRLGANAEINPKFEARNPNKFEARIPKRSRGEMGLLRELNRV
jgi:hypothetical protein